MSSDPFELLGLDRETATDADVRRAYAAKLKVSRPEDDRAGFMALRAAFERARNEMRWRGDYDAGEQEDEGHARETAEFPLGAVSIGDEPAASLIEQNSAAVPDDAPDEDAFEPAEAFFEDRIGRAMDRLVDRLTATGRAPQIREVMAIIDGADVSGIEEYQSMQWQVRQFLCDRSGYNLDPPALRVPNWLSLEVFDALDQYYGWTRQPATQSWIRRLNDWIVRVRQQIAFDALPRDARNQSELERVKTELFGEKPPPPSQGGTSGSGLGWLGLAGGIIGYALFEFFTRGSTG